MDLRYFTVKVPELKKPVRLFHITDSHLTLAGAEEPEAVQKASKDLTAVFRPKDGRTTRELLESAVEKARELNSDCVVMSGDMMSFAGRENLSVLKSILDTIPCVVYVTGNHDWYYPGEPDNVEQIRRMRLDRLARALDMPADFLTREVGGVLLAGVDNGSYQVTWQQYESMKAALDRGLPTVLFCHIPLYAPTLVADTARKWRIPILMGCPEGCLEANHPLLPTEATRAFLELVEHADNLCAVLTGHLHLWHTDALTPRLTQYVTNMGPDDCAAVFDLVP